MLNILVSKYNQAVEDEIFNRAIEEYRSGEEVYILVPEQFTLQNELRLMEQLNDTAVSGIKIMSFRRLALEALSKIGGLKRSYIDRMGKSMVLKNILSANRKELVLYADSVEKEGFVDLLLRQMAEFKRSLITPEKLREYAQRVQNVELLYKKLTELATIYELFENALAGKYVDNEDRLGQLAELKTLKYLSDKKIFIYSFLDFTAVEREIIANLMRSSSELTVGLCLDVDASEKKESTAFYASYRTFEQLQSSARENNIRYEAIPIAGQNVHQSSEIQFLGEELFKIVPQKKEENIQDISLFEAHFADEEIRHIALEIKRMVVEEGYRYKDFMVVAGDLDRYCSPIRQIFEQYSIPFFIDEKRSIMNSPIVKVILSAMNLLGGDFSVKNMMVFLKNDIRFMGEQAHRIYHFENYILSKKLKHKMFLDDRYFMFEQTGEDLKNPDARSLTKTEERSEIGEERSLSQAEGIVQSENIFQEKDAGFSTENSQSNHEDEETSLSPQDRAVLEVRRDLIERFVPFLKKAEGKKTAREFGELIYDLLEKQKMVEQIQRLIEDLRKNDLLDEANENSQVWNIFVHILEQANEVFGEEPMTLKQYKTLITDAIKSHELSVIPPAQDQVIVGDADRSRSDSKKVLYICGVNSGNIPKTYQESGVLSQEEKSLLSTLRMDIPSEQSRVDHNEQLMIYILLTRATEKLCISYSVEGARLKSPLIDSIKEILPNIPIHTMRDYNAKDLISVPRPTIDKMAREIRHFVKGESSENIWREVLAFYEKNEETKTMADVAMSGIFYDNTKQKIRSADMLYSMPMKLSTTRIRSFQECPFKHFIQYGLRAKERKEYSIQPAEMGLVLHSTVEKVVRDLKDDYANIFEMTREQTDKMVEAHFDLSAQNLLKEYDLEESRNRFMLKRLKKTAKQISFASVEHMRGGEFLPVAQEARFDDGEEIPPIIIDLNGKEIKLTGTIDRIDILKDGERVFVKVIDYKTSNKEFSLSDAYNGLDIQLMVYLSAALNSKKLVRTENYPAGVFYFPIVDPMIESEERSVEELQKLIRGKIKMDGIVLDDQIVLQGLDKQYVQETKYKSEIYNSASQNRLSKQQFDLLLKHIHQIVEASLEQILDGEISARPILQNGNKEKTGCRFCRYASICRFEEELGDRYRAVYKYSNEDILKKLEKQGGDER